MNSYCADKLNAITSNDCDKLIQIANETSFNPGQIINLETDNEVKLTDTQYRQCNVSFLSVDKISSIQEKLFDSLTQINSKEFNFILQGITDIQVIKYDVGSFYKKHIDIRIDELGYQRKLTFIIQLSESSDYTGGDLILYSDDNGKKASRSKGSITVFPSFVLHEVTPILSGTRYSMIGWCFGPEFR